MRTQENNPALIHRPLQLVRHSSARIEFAGGLDHPGEPRITSGNTIIRVINGYLYTLGVTNLSSIECRLAKQPSR